MCILCYRSGQRCAAYVELLYIKKNSSGGLSGKRAVPVRVRVWVRCVGGDTADRTLVNTVSYINVRNGFLVKFLSCFELDIAGGQM